MQFIEKFDRENIDGQHLRLPLLAIATRNYMKIFDGLLAYCQMCQYFPPVKELCMLYVATKTYNVYLIY